MPRAQVQVHGAPVGGRRARRRVTADRESLGDCVRHVVRDREQLLLRPVEALGPELETVGHADDARAHAQHRAGAAHRPLDHDLHTQLAPDGAHVAVVVAEARDGAARQDLQARRHRQRVGQVVAHALGEVRVLRGPQVAERQHRDALCVRLERQRRRGRYRLTARGRSRQRQRRERRRHLRRRREAVLALARHAPHHELRGRRRKVRHLRARVGRWVHEARRGDGPDALAGPRALAGEALEEHRAERVQVDARVEILHALDLLGRHVRRRAERQAQGGGPRGIRRQRAGDAEVGDDDAAVAAEQHVVRLEVAVDDAGAVSGVEPRAKGTRDLDDHRHRKGPLAGDPGRERLALDELHREELLALALADVEGARDVAVGHAPGELHLLAEPVEHPRLVEHLLAQQLEGDHLVELRVPRAVDGAHPTRADEADDLVTPGECVPAGSRRGGQGGLRH